MMTCLSRALLRSGLVIRPGRVSCWPRRSAAIRPMIGHGCGFQALLPLTLIAGAALSEPCCSTPIIRPPQGLAVLAAQSDPEIGASALALDPETRATSVPDRGSHQPDDSVDQSAALQPLQADQSAEAAVSVMPEQSESTAMPASESPAEPEVPAASEQGERTAPPASEPPAHRPGLLDRLRNRRGILGLIAIGALGLSMALGNVLHRPATTSTTPTASPDHPVHIMAFYGPLASAAPAAAISGATAPAPMHMTDLLRRALAQERRAIDLHAALALYDRAVRTDPGNAAAYYYRGDLRVRLGDVSGGLNDYQQAQTLDASAAQAAYHWGRISMARGDLRTAIE